MLSRSATFVSGSLSRETERLLLQAAIAIGGFVPVGAGLTGALLGAGMTGPGTYGIDLDSHVRYLSGLLLGIGLAFWEAIPEIERRGPRVKTLTMIIVLGGLIRLVGILAVGMPGSVMLVDFALELVATPLICLWQRRLARRFDVLD